MVKKISSFLVIFLLGFLTHAILFPDLLLEQLNTGVKESIGVEKKTPSERIEPLIREIKFSETGFSPKTVVIRFTNYVAIINTSEDTLMSLQSTHPLLSTARGYGLGEQQKAAMNIEGTFTVSDTQNPTHELTVIVKK